MDVITPARRLQSKTSKNFEYGYACPAWIFDDTGIDKRNYTYTTLLFQINIDPIHSQIRRTSAFINDQHSYGINSCSSVMVIFTNDQVPVLANYFHIVIK